MIKNGKALFVVALLALVSIVALTPGPAKAAHGADPFGQGISLSVHPSRAGWCVAFEKLTYCQPFRAERPRAVDVLTPGATYTRTYWDWAGFGGTYSYVGRALRDGRATVAFDRVGDGPSTDVTMATDAATLHRIAVGLRLLGYRQIVSVSHSLGSGIALAEAATDYPDHVKVDAVVVSGYLHRPSNPLVTAGNYPASQDPKFAAAGLDDGWLTTRPGARLYGFHASDSDLVLVAQDEDRKQLVSRTSLLDFLGQRGAPAATNVSHVVAVPVLVLIGERDAIFCLDPAVFDCSDRAAVEANELPYYQAATVATQPRSGHSLALHPTAGDSYQLIVDWMATL